MRREGGLVFMRWLVDASLESGERRGVCDELVYVYMSCVFVREGREGEE